jgi:probable phosphoglycerate mutase
MTANSLMTKKDHKVYLVRHGETEWSLSGQHTGVTDIPLTENGRAAARFLQPVLAQESFKLVLTSPLGRARETCELAGLGDRGEVEADLMEWNYGEYEGLTPQQIHARRPKWMIFRDGCPGGESPRQIAERADRVIAKAHAQRETWHCSRMATFSACSWRVGLASRHAPASISCSALRP